MANEEHLAILKQGVEVWNKWRAENPEIHTDLGEADLTEIDLRNANLYITYLKGADLEEVILSEADLRGADLRGADLRGSDLRGADLYGADCREALLRGADLGEADLRSVDLSGAILSEADLRGADLRGAELSEANLSEADLRGANLRGAKLRDANLYMANFKEVDLRGVKLSRADLIGADLRGAILIHTNLYGAKLIGAKLSRADLSGANLGEAKLSGADLSGVNLQNAALQAAQLIKAKLDEANLTDACLWETQRAGWSIRGVICESVYWDSKAESKITYRPGEFERLFAEQTRIKLFYKDGISPLEVATLPALIKHLEEAHPANGLRLVSIREESGGAVVELAIEQDDNYQAEQVKQLQSALETTANELIQFQRQALFEKETRLRLEGRIEQLSTDYDKLIVRPHIIVNTQGGSMGDTYKIKGQAGAVGPDAHAHDITFNQIWNQVQNSIDLSQLAEELSVLRQTLKKEAVEPEHDISVSEVAKAEQAAKSGNGAKALEHLKSAGKWALDAATKIGTSLAVEAIKKSMGP